MTSSHGPPWWFWPVGLAILFPPLAFAACDRVEAGLEQYSVRLEERADGAGVNEQADVYIPPCDTDAVLDALGMSAGEYQASRGLYVDGWVGPQTAAALCAEELPVGDA